MGMEAVMSKYLIQIHEVNETIVDWCDAVCPVRARIAVHHDGVLAVSATFKDERDAENYATAFIDGLRTSHPEVAARDIDSLVRVERYGLDGALKRDEACEHESEWTMDGNGAYCRHCGETLS
jgi:hypothetical protein